MFELILITSLPITARARNTGGCGVRAGVSVEIFARVNLSVRECLESCSSFTSINYVILKTSNILALRAQLSVVTLTSQTTQQPTVAQEEQQSVVSPAPLQEVAYRVIN